MRIRAGSSTGVVTWKNRNKTSSDGLSEKTREKNNHFFEANGSCFMLVASQLPLFDCEKAGLGVQATTNKGGALINYTCLHVCVYIYMYIKMCVCVCARVYIYMVPPPHGPWLGAVDLYFPTSSRPRGPTTPGRTRRCTAPPRTWRSGRRRSSGCCRTTPTSSSTTRI